MSYMPHYKDWSGRMSATEYPDNSGEHWGNFDNGTDVSNNATAIAWHSYDSNDQPAALSQPLFGNFWDNYNISRPECVCDYGRSGSTARLRKTDYMVWNVSWIGNVGDISGPLNNMKTLQELTNVQTTPYSSLDSIYFQVNYSASPVPEPSTGLLLGLALGASLLLRSVRRAFGLTSGIVLVLVLV